MTTVELFAAVTGVGGSLLLAWRGRWAGWAWMLWIVSSFAWIAFAVRIGSVPLLAQHVFFSAVNVLGVYRWLIRKPPLRNV